MDNTVSHDLWRDFSERLSSLQDDMTKCRESQANMNAKLTSLLGNGQPGRLQSLEETVSHLTAALNRLKGAGAVLSLLFGAWMTYLHFWR